MDQLEFYIEDPVFIKWVFHPDEETESYFRDFILKNPDQEKELHQLRKELRLFAIKKGNEITYIQGQRIFQAISGKISKRKSLKLKHLVHYAAVAVIFFAIGSLVVYLMSGNKTDLRFTEELFLKNARHYPVLYHASGTEKEIKSGELDLSAESSSGNKYQSNVLVVPNGQRLQVTLEDKSLVWLNAGSRLIFPSEFHSGKREVYLAGEAYFDITKNPRNPFFVNTSSIAIKVLGTRFNVSSYPDDEEVVTVLEEGRIQLIDNQSALPEVKAELAPNQLARLDKSSNKLKITNSDYELHTLWKEGILRFEQESINQLINRLERYYGITIILKHAPKGEEKVKGKLDLNAGMPKVLEYLTKITQTHVVQVNTSTYILE
ncbi:MAG: FecR family protein [Mangrovibacterium sp.]